ncbi:hypothetical protein EVAR_66496_1 [Eumeta japonica]|uniref:Uncharacterized protein n=1 Tax=Eumeta variegata TaxID=151549 RepID=A0A4C2AEN4_EUMVA|nr:hypothetical protein EVAR_66496_1 [Eumeta japonica]
MKERAYEPSKRNDFVDFLLELKVKGVEVIRNGNFRDDETFLACGILSQKMQPEVRFAGNKSYSRRRPNILVPVQALHTDGRHFKDAAKYKPERFD